MLERSTGLILGSSEMPDRACVSQWAGSKCEQSYTRETAVLDRQQVPLSSLFDHPCRICGSRQAHPHAIALELGCAEAPAAATLSYKELSDRARDLALGLVAFGVKPGDHAGFATARNFDVVVAMLGILWAGVAYIPLDLSYPSRPLGKM